RLKYAIAIYKSVIKQVFIPEAWLPGDSTLRRFTTLADKQNPPDPEKNLFDGSLWDALLMIGKIW
ncbi:MAG: hypothetical protein MSH27_03280, partial [Desulfovibrio piger]